jgi:SNF2 family DNA or RNA helicase
LIAKLFIPRSYQAAGTNFILDNPRCNLQVDMGLGKTIMVLNALDILYTCGEYQPTLILAPLRVARTTWSAELAKWNHLSGLEISPIVGTPEQRIAALKRDVPVYTINYENIVWLTKYLKGAWPFRTIIADESTKIKSHRVHWQTNKQGTTYLCHSPSCGERTKALTHLAWKKTRRWVNLTGTPAPNSLGDLWGQNWFIDQGASLGSSYSAFEDRWFKTDYNGYDKVMLPHAEKEIRAAIAPTTFTLRAEDYLDLGEEIVNTIYVDLPPKARKHYDEMEKDLYTIIKAGEVEAFTAATKSMKCHQLANGALYHDDKGTWEAIHDEKLDALRDVIEEAGGMPVIVCYKFKSDLARLKKAFPQGKALDTRQETEDNFKSGKIPILFIHPDSAGHGIDYMQHVTNIMCFFSVDWNAETRDQVIARIGKVRQFQAGLNRPVFIHQIITRNSVDEIILRRLGTKMTVQEALKEGLARRGLK